MYADIVLKGKIFTSDKEALYAEAAAIEGDKITYVGSKEGIEELIGPDTRIIESGDGLFVPGMVDSHMHFSSGATESQYKLSLIGLNDVETYKKEIRRYIEENPEREYYMGVGWENGVFDAAGPRKEIIDEICSDKPVLLQAIDGHSYWVNSETLRKAGIGKGYVTKEVGEIVLDEETKEPTGLVREWAMNDVFRAIRPYSIDEIKAAILVVQEELLKVGLTSVYEPILRDEETAQQALEELDKEGRLKLKVVSGFYCKPEKESLEKIDECARIRDAYQGKHYSNNNIKFVLDGVVEAATAYMSEEYAHEAGRYGNFNCTQEQYNAMVKKAKEEGFQVHVHAIGDAAISAAITGFEYAQKENPAEDWRPAITHLQIVKPEDFERMARVHAIACCDPIWHYKDPIYFDALEVPYLGLERASNEYPLKSFADANVVITCATDFPVSDPNPMLGIEIGCTRREPGDTTDATVLREEEALTVEEMLMGYTINGAYQNCMEDRTGSIQVGKSADIVLLDRDITTIAKHEIHTAEPVFTMIDGVMMYER